MKRIITILLALVMLLSLSACGGKYTKDELKTLLDSVTYEQINDAGNMASILKKYSYCHLQYTSITSDGKSKSEMVFTKDEQGNLVQQGKMAAADHIDIYTKDGATLYYYTLREYGVFDVYPLATYSENFLAYYSEALLKDENVKKSIDGQSLVYEMTVGKEGNYDVYERKTFYIDPDTLLPEKTVLEIIDRNEILMETIECEYTYGDYGKTAELPEVIDMNADPEAMTLTVIDLDKNGAMLAQRSYPVIKDVEVSAWDFLGSYTPYLDAACTTPMIQRVPMTEDLTLYLKEN